MQTRQKMQRTIQNLQLRMGGRGPRHYDMSKVYIRTGAALVDPTVGALTVIQLLRGFLDDFCGSGVSALWTQTLTGGASIYISTSAHGGDVVLKAPSSISADDALLTFGGKDCLCCGSGVESLMIWKTKLNSAANIRVHMGLNRAREANTERVMVVLDTAVDGNWHLFTSSGGAETDTDTGEAADDVDHWYKLTLSSDLVKLYIDDMGVPVAIHRTNITSYNMEPYIYVKTLAAAEKRMELDFVAIIPDAGVSGITGS